MIDSQYSRYSRRARVVHIVLLVAAGLGLVAVAIFGSGTAVAYMLGLAALAGAAVLVVAACLPPRARRRAILGATVLASLAAAAVAVVVPRQVLSADRGDRIVTFDTTGNVAGAWQVGDVVVLDLQPESGDAKYAIVDVESGRELGRHPGSGDHVIGRGPVALVRWTDTADFTAIGVDGTELWTSSLAADGREHVEPVAVYDDGTLIVKRGTLFDDRWELVAVDTDGRERWSREVPFDVRLVEDLTWPRSDALPNHLLAVRGNPVQDGERLVLVVDEATGDFDEFDRAAQATAGLGFFALLRHEDEACTATLLDEQLVELQNVELECERERFGEADFAASERHVAIAVTAEDVACGISACAERYVLVDAATGETEDFSVADYEPDRMPPFATNISVGEQDLSAGLRRVGGDMITVPASWTMSVDDNLETIRAFHTAESRNPMRPSDQTEVVLFDVATAERCASARFDTDKIESLSHSSTYGLPGCRAVVEIDGEITLIGSENDA